MRLSVVIPAYNERNTIAELLRRVCAVAIDKEIIIVDDGSSDGTIRELAPFGIHASGDRSDFTGEGGAVNSIELFVHEVNQGKGASVRDGIERATGDILLIQDADLEYDPAEYPKLLQPILDGRADVVYGSRFTGSPRRVLFFWHALGNHLLTFVSNMMTNLNLTDMETCYKVFRAEVIKGVPIRSRRFGIEPELTAKVARLRARIYEVPISYAGRSYLEGKKIGWKDGISAIWTILKFRFLDDLGDADPAYTTLRRMEALRKYNSWVWGKLAPFVGARVLEVGAGIGNMTRLLSARARVVATDLNPTYLQVLRRTFAGDSRVAIHELDLAAEFAPTVGKDFDTVVCLNVLEHIEDDVAALRRMRQVLAPQGRVVLVVPALQSLYGEIDRAIGHYRRYGRDELVDKLQQAGFTVEHCTGFNALGVAGWYLNSCLLRRRSVPGVQARINSWLVPLLRLEDYLGLRWGMSLLAVAHRD